MKVLLCCAKDVLGFVHVVIAVEILKLIIVNPLAVASALVPANAVVLEVECHGDRTSVLCDTCQSVRSEARSA
eukprot:scaffold5892_cov169-Pinguiococcus_pyrenoidosus.AAC.3